MDPVKETKDYVTIRVGNFELVVRKVLRSGGIDLLNLIFDEAERLRGAGEETK